MSVATQPPALQGVAIIVQRPDGRILVSRRLPAPNKSFPNHHQFPGGKMDEDQGEHNPYSAARRELKEETGYLASFLRLHHLGSDIRELAQDATKTYKGHAFHVLLNEDEVSLIKDTEPDKQTPWEWVSLAEARQLKLIPGLAAYLDRL